MLPCKVLTCNLQVVWYSQPPTSAHTTLRSEYENEMKYVKPLLGLRPHQSCLELPVVPVSDWLNM